MNAEKLKFYIDYLPIAMDLGKKYNIPPFAILVQAGIESGFGKKKIGNNMFGLKFNPKKDSLKQLVTTTEFGNDLKPNYPVVLSVTLTGKSKPKYKYKVKDYFADYATVKDSFEAYVKLLVNNPRYKNALGEKDPFLFISKVIDAGYATDPNYKKLAKSLIEEIDKAFRGKILKLPSQMQTVLASLMIGAGVFFYFTPLLPNLS